MKDRSRSVYDPGLLIVIVSALVVFTATVHSQNQTASQTPAAAAPQQSPRATPSPSPTPTPINWSTDPVLKRFVFRSIGPASMGGRIDDIAAVEQNPYIIYVGFATNGVWKSGPAVRASSYSWSASDRWFSRSASPPRNMCAR